MDNFVTVNIDDELMAYIKPFMEAHNVTMNEAIAWALSNGLIANGFDVTNIENEVEVNSVN